MSYSYNLWKSNSDFDSTVLSYLHKFYIPNVIVLNSLMLHLQEMKQVYVICFQDVIQQKLNIVYDILYCFVYQLIQHVIHTPVAKQMSSITRYEIINILQKYPVISCPVELLYNSQFDLSTLLIATLGKDMYWDAKLIHNAKNHTLSLNIHCPLFEGTNVVSPAIASFQSPNLSLQWGNRTWTLCDLTTVLASPKSFVEHAFAVPMDSFLHFFTQFAQSMKNEEHEENLHRLVTSAYGLDVLAYCLQRSLTTSLSAIDLQYKIPILYKDFFKSCINNFSSPSTILFSFCTEIIHSPWTPRNVYLKLGIPLQFWDVKWNISQGANDPYNNCTYYFNLSIASNFASEATISNAHVINVPSLIVKLTNHSLVDMISAITLLNNSDKNVHHVERTPTVVHKFLSCISYHKTTQILYQIQSKVCHQRFYNQRFIQQLNFITTVPNLNLYDHMKLNKWFQLIADHKKTSQNNTKNDSNKKKISNNSKRKWSAIEKTVVSNSI